MSCAKRAALIVILSFPVFQGYGDGNVLTRPELSEWHHQAGDMTLYKTVGEADVGQAAAGTSDKYKIRTDLYLPEDADPASEDAGGRDPATFFFSLTVPWWDDSARVAFNQRYEPHFWDTTKKEMKHFASEDNCMQYYNEKIEKFGVCAPEQGGDTSKWRAANCNSSVSQGPAPCAGTVSKACHYSSVTKEECRESITASAKMVLLNSTQFIATEQSPKKHGGKQWFLQITIKGIHSDESECEMAYAMRVGVCTSCSCKGGQITYETKSTSKKYDSYNHSRSCMVWSLGAGGAASGLFGRWRMLEAQKQAVRCAPHWLPAPTRAELQRS